MFGFTYSGRGHPRSSNKTLFYNQPGELYREGTEAPVRQAIGLFEKAIELDPMFARADVGVAECHRWLADAGKEPADVSL